MLVTLQKIINMAEQGGYCIPDDQVKAAIAAVKQLSVSKILLTGAAGKGC